MVATERKMRAETEEELKELKLEKEALKSALRLIDGENSHLRESGLLSSPHSERDTSRRSSRRHSRSSSEVAIKSRPNSLLIAPYPPLPPSPAPSDGLKTPEDDDKNLDNLLSPDVTFPDAEESQPTPRYHLTSVPLPETSSSSVSVASDPLFMGASPWADIPSSASSGHTSAETTSSAYTHAAYASIR